MSNVTGTMGNRTSVMAPYPDGSMPFVSARTRQTMERGGTKGPDREKEAAKKK